MRYALLLALLLGGCIGPNHSVSDLLTPDEFHLFYTDGSGDSSGSLGSTREPWRFKSASDLDYTAWTAGLTWNLTAPQDDSGMREAVRAMQLVALRMAEAAEAARNAPEPVVIVQAPEVVPAPVAAPEPIQVIVEAPAPVVVPPVIVERTAPSSGPTVLTLPPALEAALLAMVSRVAAEPRVAPAAPVQPVVVPAAPAPDINITVENAATQTAPVQPVRIPDPTPDPNDAPKEPQGVMLLGLSNEVWLQIVGVMSLLVTLLGTYLGREKIPVIRDHTKKGKAAKAEKAVKDAEEKS